MRNGLSSLSSAALADVSDKLSFRRGELIYSEGKQPAGAYIVTTGSVKLIASSPCAGTYFERIANPGDIIGLSAALAGCQNDTNAEALEPTSVCYVTTESLYWLMTFFSDISLWLAEQLSIEYFDLCREVSLLDFTEVG